MKRKKKLLLLFTSVFFLTLFIGAGVILGIVKYRENVSNRQQEPKDDIAQTAAFTEMHTGITEEENGKKENAKKEQSSSALSQDAGMTDEAENVWGDAENALSEADEAEEKQPKKAVLVFGGDICFHDAYSNMHALSQRGGSMKNVIAPELMQEMTQADVCLVNNEFSYSDRGVPLAEKTYTFRSKPENVNLLSEMGVDIVALANNHAYDYGKDAFLDTLTILDEAGIERVGGGKDLGEASKPVFFEVNGIKIGYLAATQIERTANPDTKGATESEPGVLRCFTDSELEHFLSLVASTKEECDFLVAFLHWGTESTDVLDWAQPYQADLIAKAGANLIVGAHPHVLQGVDVVNQVPVIYSLGNYWFNSKTMDTMLLKVTINAEGVEEIKLIPALQTNCTTQFLTESEKSGVLLYLQSLSPNVTIDEDGVMTW